MARDVSAYAVRSHRQVAEALGISHARVQQLEHVLLMHLPADVADALTVVQRGRVVVFGQPDAVVSLLGPARAVPR